MARSSIFVFLIIALIFSIPILGSTVIKRDHFKRVIYDSSKIQVECPNMNSNTGVLFFSGQSNAGNHAEYLVGTEEVPNVLNYFNGKCYKASSPMLGGSYIKGDFNALAGQYLVDKGLFTTVIIANTSSGGSKIGRWANKQDLGGELIKDVAALQSKYKIAAFIWIQGESDAHAKLSTDSYIESFLGIIKNLELRKTKVPVFLAVATKCKNYSKLNNTVSIAQEELIDSFDFIQLAINMNQTLGDEYRKDKCHLNKAGQFKAANIIGENLYQYLMGN
jgi:hypothetical protein